MKTPGEQSSFKTGGGMLLAGSAAGSVVVGDASGNVRKRPWKKGYMLNTFPPAKGLSTEDKFRLIKEAGFDGVEPSSHMDRDELRQASEATGLQVASISCGQHTRLFAHPAASEREKGIEGLRYALETAKALGVKSVLVVAGGVNERNASYAENYERTRDSIQQLIPLAERLGVAMAIENVWNDFLLSPLEAARYVDEFKSSAVGWHFDVGNIMSIGFPEDWIRILSHRIKAVHFKEFSREKMNNEGLRKGFSVEYLEGDNDWPAILKALETIGYQGWAIVEPACGECKQGSTPADYLKKVSGQLDKILSM